MNANITQRASFIYANELCAKHLGLRVRIETRAGARVTDELIAIHAEVNGPDPERSVFVRLATTQPSNPNNWGTERGSYFDIAELSEVTIWEDA